MAEETTTPTPPAPPPEDYSVVVMGAMNPRIHHPLWYRQKELISEAEAIAAMEGPFAHTPEISQFVVAGMQVTCLAERWDVKSSDPANRSRMLDLAAAIFDRALPETPVTLFAFNNDCFRRTNASRVTNVLGKLAGRMGLVPRAVSGASVRLTFEGVDGGPHHVQIDGGVRFPDHVVVRVNSNHPIDLSKMPPGRFDLGPMMRQHFDPDHAAAKELSDNVVNAINETEAR